MNVLQYFEQAFPQHPVLAEKHPNYQSQDDETYGDYLAEMPVESNCGSDCVHCIDAAIAMHSHITNAFGTDEVELIRNNLLACLRVCVCYIRG